MMMMMRKYIKLKITKYVSVFYLFKKIFPWLSAGGGDWQTAPRQK